MLIKQIGRQFQNPIDRVDHGMQGPSDSIQYRLVRGWIEDYYRGHQQDPGIVQLGQGYTTTVVSMTYNIYDS